MVSKSISMNSTAGTSGARKKSTPEGFRQVTRLSVKCWPIPCQRENELNNDQIDAIYKEATGQTLRPQDKHIAYSFAKGLLAVVPAQGQQDTYKCGDLSSRDIQAIAK